MSPQAEILMLAVLAAMACALLGCFLFLRRMSLLGDAISHVLLFGIVLAFLLVRDLASPWLLVGAALSGVLLVALVELLERGQFMKEDAAIGLVFPALFSIGVILISRHAGNIHLDVDAVLLGELAYAPQRRTEFLGLDVPESLPKLIVIFILNLLFVGVFFKELKLSTFDPSLASAFGFTPSRLHYALVTLVAMTCVAAFDAVGSVLVVALLIVPPSTAFLLTHRLSFMLIWAMTIGALGAFGGFLAGEAWDVNYAGAMASALGIVFAATMLFAPGQGVLAQWLKRRRQKSDFDVAMLLGHLATHDNMPEMASECDQGQLHDHLQWPDNRIRATLSSALANGWVTLEGSIVRLTDAGRAKESQFRRPIS